MARIAIAQELLREWDPLDLSPGDFAPADEYDSYAPAIVSLVLRGASPPELAEHLRGLQLSEMGTDSLEPVAARMIGRLRDP